MICQIGCHEIEVVQENDGSGLCDEFFSGVSGLKKELQTRHSP